MTDTSKKDEILGVINELEAEYDFFIDFRQGLEQQAESKNIFLQEIAADELRKGEDDGDTAVRQAVDFLKEYAETL